MADPPKPSLIIGQRGVQYGLQVRKAPGAAAKPAAARPAAVFGMDSDSDDDVGAQVARQAAKKQSDAKVTAMHEQALQQDASVFDYDGVYDEMQAAKVQPKQQEKIQRHSRYIATLKEKAEERKRLDDLAYERKLLKERQAEDALYEGKEAFVTAAYRRKLEEDKKWREAEKAKEAEEAANDVRKVGHLGNFYKNLLTKNVAYGGGSSAAAAAGAAATAAADTAAATASGGRESVAAGGGESLSAPSAAAAKTLAKLDEYERLRLEADRARQAPGHGPGGRSVSAEPLAVAAAAGRAGSEPRGASLGPGEASEVPSAALAAASELEAAEPGTGALAAAEAAAAAAPQPAPEAAKRRTTEDKANEALQRYLERKKQRTGAA